MLNIKDFLLYISENIEDEETKNYIVFNINYLTEKINKLIHFIEKIMFIINSDNLIADKINHIQKITGADYMSSLFLIKIATKIDNIFRKQIGGADKEKKNESSDEDKSDEEEESESNNEDKSDSDENEEEVTQSFLQKVYSKLTFIPRDTTKFNIMKWPSYTSLDYGVHDKEESSDTDTKKKILKLDNSDVEPLNYGYILLILLSTLPIIGEISNFVLICKSLQEDRYFLASIVTLSSILSFFTPSFISPLARPDAALKLFYVLDNYSYLQYRKNENIVYPDEIRDIIENNMDPQNETQLSIDEIKKHLNL